MNQQQPPILSKADRRRLRNMKMNRQIAEIQEKWLPYANKHQELYAFRCSRDGVKYFFDDPDQAKRIGAFNFNEQICKEWNERLEELKELKIPKPLWMEEEDEKPRQRIVIVDDN